MVNKNVIFIKTPKCASTSLKSELLRYSLSNGLKVLDNAIGFKNEFNHKSKWLNQLNSNSIFSKQHEGKRFNINLDHVTGTDKNINRLKYLMDDEYDFLTIGVVRDPLERLISNYLGTPRTNWVKTSEGFNNWYLKNHDKNVTEIFKGVEKVFPDFWMNDFMSNYLSVDGIDEVESKYDLIVVSENYKIGLERLGSLLDFNFKVTHKNNTIGKVKITPSSEVINLFTENNHKDYLLYNKCKEIYL